jgi:hypothetical protein
VSGRKILIPLRFDWRGEMEVAWFSAKLFKAVILNGGGYRKFEFQFGRGMVVLKRIFNIKIQFFVLKINMLLLN